MSPLLDRNKAKEGGFAQVREALIAFDGDVVEVNSRGDKTEFATWGTSLDDSGKPKAPKEFLQIVCVNVVPTEVTEDLSMDITEGWTFRVNCSDFKGSFWVDAFLESADKFKIQIPEGMIGKRLSFRKKTLEAKNKNGTVDPKFNSTNFIIIGFAGNTPTVAAKSKPATQSTLPLQETPAPASVPTPVSQIDYMEIARNLAVGKTEQQFRSAIGLDPNFANSPLLPLAKAGAITQSLVSEGKLKVVQQGSKQVYQLG